MAVPGETREKEADKEMACERGGEMGHCSFPSRPWCRHQPMVYGPLYLLWVAVLAVATGPATCFVVPSSRLRSCSSFFATASLPPKLVVGNQALRGRGSPVDERSSSLRQTVYAVIKHGGDDVGGAHGSRQGVPQRQGESSAKAGRSTGSGGLHSIATQSGTRAGDQVLHASLPGLDVESKVSSAASDTKRVLILMSDTGGGHRASSEALSAALKDLYGDQIQADIVDVWTSYGRFPFSSAVDTYKFLGKHPRLWKLSYDMARFPPTRRWAELLANLSCHRNFRECFEKYDPDLVVSTHPLCHHVPHKVLTRMRKDSGKYIPFVTVVTDLGSAHPTWFDPRGDLVYVPSDVLQRRAAARGIPQHKLLQFGLPVRHAFWDEPMEKSVVQEKLGLRRGVQTALIVGGGDGVGKLQDIATQVAEQLVADRHEGQVVVVCGKNEKTKQALEDYSWPNEKTGVTVRVLGFVANMDEWMSAADLLVTKAGPGTIAEACTRGLPLILSSFLPGQEAGNVPYVTENEFGFYHKRPADIARAVSDLLADRGKLETMGAHARALGRPRASLDIARSIVSNLMPGTIEIPRAPLPSP